MSKRRISLGTFTIESLDLQGTSRADRVEFSDGSIGTYSLGADEIKGLRDACLDTASVEIVVEVPDDE